MLNLSQPDSYKRYNQNVNQRFNQTIYEKVNQVVNQGVIQKVSQEVNQNINESCSAVTAASKSFLNLGIHLLLLRCLTAAA